MYQKNKQEINANLKYGQVNRPYKKWIQKVIYGKLYYHFNNLCSM